MNRLPGTELPLRLVLTVLRPGALLGSFNLERCRNLARATRRIPRPVLVWSAAGGLALALLFRGVMAAPVAAAAVEGPAEPMTGALFSRVLLGLLVVLAIIGAGAGALKLNAKKRSRGRMSLGARLPLGRSASAVIVTVHGRDLLLGVTPQSITLLEHLGESEPDTAATASGFASVLQSMAGGQGSGA